MTEGKKIGRRGILERRLFWKKRKKTKKGRSTRQWKRGFIHHRKRGPIKESRQMDIPSRKMAKEVTPTGSYLGDELGKKGEKSPRECLVD